MDHIAQLENMKANGFDLGFDNADYDAINAAIAALRAVREAPVVEVAKINVGDHGPHVIYTSQPQGARFWLLPVNEGES